MVWGGGTYGRGGVCMGVGGCCCDVVFNGLMGVYIFGGMLVWFLHWVCCSVCEYCFLGC